MEKLPFEISKSCIGWSVQIAGASCLISSIHLANNGLYVNVPRGDFLLPATIDDFSNFNTTVMPVLALLTREIVSIGDKLLFSLKEKTNVKSPLGRIEPSTINYMSYYQWDTWYTPPGCSQSQIPSHLFGFSPPPSILQKLMSLSYEAVATSDGSYTTVINDPNGHYDEFGFKKVANGYYSGIIDSVWDFHSHEEEFEN